MKTGARKRANFLGVPQFFNLNQVCRGLVDAFGQNVYLVGSALHSRDYRDVDVRCILDDKAFSQMFPGAIRPAHLHPLWSLMCCSISEWLAARTGLPIDFQIQSMTEANEKYPGNRNALGLFIERA